MEGTTILGRELDSCRDVREVRRVYARIQESAHASNRFLRNKLVKMYGRCGSIEEAWGVFQSIQSPNVYSWNMIITALAQNGQLQRAKSLHDTMPHERIVASNAILTAYTQRGHIQEARKLFDLMHDRDVISWTVMVGAYARNGHLGEARKMFDNMPQRNLVSWNTMINAYMQIGNASEARKLFEKMPQKDLVSWTSMITGYAGKEESENAIRTFQFMDLDGVTADKVTFAAAVDACNSVELGKILHLEIVENGIETDVVLLSSLVSMYGKLFDVENARKVFDSMYLRNAMSWNVMIVAYAQNGRGVDAISLFRKMDVEGILPDEFSFAGVFDSCTSAAMVTEGRHIHACLVEDPSLQRVLHDVVVGTALVNMYGKCGFLQDAKCVFDTMPAKDVLTVTSMICSCAQVGLFRHSLEAFGVMFLEGIEALDRVVFISLLSSCSHGGLLYEGHQVFVSMGVDYGIPPGFDHYMCMVDLLGRSGKLQDAMELIEYMPFEPDIVAWTSLLSGCATQDELRGQTSMAENAVKLEPEDSGSYELLLRACC